MDSNLRTAFRTKTMTSIILEVLDRCARKRMRVMTVAFVLSISIPSAALADEGRISIGRHALADEPNIAKTSSSDVDRIRRLIETLMTRGAKIQSHSATFHRREFRSGSLQSKEKMKLRHQSRTGKVYLRWLDGENAGRELLYTPAKNSVAVTAMMMTLHFAPDHWLIRKSSRHPISDIGVRKLTELIARDYRLASKHDFTGVTYKLLAPRKNFRRMTTCFEISTPKDKVPAYYAYRSIVCVDDKNQLPIYVKVWDREAEKIRVIEELGYENLRVNPILPVDAFSEESAEYSF